MEKMATKREIDARTKIRNARDDQAYNDKIAAMLAADTKEEKAKKESRKKTDDALKYALTNAIYIGAFCIFWRIYFYGFYWTWE